jgi:2-dehydro-3-deoxyphosphogluconate aldolase / (4S)-4-hydroxy-2-oxoglutarate aldolase
MQKEEVRNRIVETGIVPVIRTSSPEEAIFAADAVARAGVSIAEITMTVPQAVEVISRLGRELPHVLVGAGTVLDAEMARSCLKAGASFLVSPGFDLEIVKLAAKENVVMMAGALTPTEVLTAWNTGADFVNLFPCARVGGPAYVKALKGPFAQVPLVPTGGVTLETAADSIGSGAAALGVGGELIVRSVLQQRRADILGDLARRLLMLLPVLAANDCHGDPFDCRRAAFSLGLLSCGCGSPKLDRASVPAALGGDLRP